MLKQGIPFLWDVVAQKSFDDLKAILINSPMFHPSNYYQDYFLYLATTPTTIAIVLVQDNDEGNEHAIYYLSRNLLDTETHYAHVEKLGLALPGYSTLSKLHPFAHDNSDFRMNPVTYILTRHLLGGRNILNGL